VRSRTVIAVVAALAVFAAVAIAVWHVDSDSGGRSEASSTTVQTQPVGVPAQIVSTATLKSIASAAGRPIYWVGPRRGARLEFTQTEDGNTFVRYLTDGADAGNQRNLYVVVATYAQPEAYARVRSVARQKHYATESLANGAVAVVPRESPRNVHVVFPGLPYQVEVYAPTSAQAKQIARSRALAPVG
jgi:hypothetical protein